MADYAPLIRPTAPHCWNNGRPGLLGCVTFPPGASDANSQADQRTLARRRRILDRDGRRYGARGHHCRGTLSRAGNLRAGRAGDPAQLRSGGAGRTAAALPRAASHRRGRRRAAGVRHHFRVGKFDRGATRPSRRRPAAISDHHPEQDPVGARHHGRQYDAGTRRRDVAGPQQGAEQTQKRIGCERTKSLNWPIPPG